jgi:four helix bundle protein
MAAYTGLVAWQRGMDLVVEVYEFTSTLPKEERYGLCAKLQRAAVSIPSNIAEGNSRRRRGAYINHSSIAIGSQAEVETLLQLCTRLHFGDPTRLARCLTSAREVGKLLYGLQSSLERSASRDRALLYSVILVVTGIWHLVSGI